MGRISENNTKEKAMDITKTKETNADKSINVRKADAFTARKERLYEKLINKLHITIGAMNVFIAVAVIALILVLIFGRLQ